MQRSPTHPFIVFLFISQYNFPGPHFPKHPLEFLFFALCILSLVTALLTLFWDLLANLVVIY